jgi:hypothetical protein
MAVNEYGTLSDLHAAAGDHSAASRAFDRGWAIANAYGDAALIARIATDGAMQFRQAGRFATVLASHPVCRARPVAARAAASIRADRLGV